MAHKFYNKMSNAKKVPTSEKKEKDIYERNFDAKEIQICLSCTAKKCHGNCKKVKRIG